jgi:peptidoglycan/xylan/chitin deacetylase (PgdA/CDA1 family)
LLLAVMVVVLVVSLLVQGYTHHLYNNAADGAARPPGPSSQVPLAVSSGGPVISSASVPRTARVRSGTIALTFDDGPDPLWTPKALEVLRRHHVHATFFVVGTQVAEHPEILREIVADGHQVGVHTFTHTDLGRVPPWRQSLELNETQLVIAGATGQTTSLLRPPYSSSNAALENDEWAAIRNAAAGGYLTVLTTLDSQDWRRPGVDAIVANVTPKGKRGQVLLMHDGGGDRAQTMAALDRLLPRLTRQGFTFATVSDAIGMGSPMRPAPATSAGLGLALIAALRFVDWLMLLITWLLYASGALTLLRGIAVVVAARRHQRLRTRPWGPPVTAPASVIIPAYNESAGIERRCVHWWPPTIRLRSSWSMTAQPTGRPTS